MRTLTFFLACTTALCSIASETNSWDLRLAQLSDEQFIGALTDEDITLATTIANDLRGKLAGPDKQCGEPDPMAGTYIGNVLEDKNLSPEIFIANADPALRPLLSKLKTGPYRQDAIIFYSLSLLGPKAFSVEPYLNWFFQNREPWAAHALEAITCQRYRATNLHDIATTYSVDFGMNLRSCKPEYLPQIFALGLQPEYIWPVETIEETIGGGSSNCAHIDVSESPVEKLVPEALSLLQSSKVSSRRKTEALQIIHDTFPALSPTLADILPSLIAHEDEDLRFVAERVTMQLGTELSSRLFVHWLEQGYEHWLWEDYIPNLESQRERIIPALLRHMRSAPWSEKEAAVKSIGFLGAKDVIPDLVGEVSDEDWLLVGAIIEAIKPFARTDPVAAECLQIIAKTYWSPYIREKANQALNPESIKNKADGVERIYIGFKTVDHGLPTCIREKTPYYIFSDETRAKIRWQVPKREPLPRGEYSDISSWCGDVGEFVVHELEDGWLAGCFGFEASGSLAFLPKDRKKPIQRIANLATTGILEFQEELYVTGLSWFSSGSELAGQLYQLKRNDDNWQLQPYILLPTVSQATAIVDDFMLFDDDYSTVAIDSNKKVYPLSCPESAQKQFDEKEND